jgi:purine-binding chemotaxis protein CheW
MDTRVNLGPMARAAKPDIGKQEFLVFRLGDQNFGIDVRKVQELRHYDTLARVADGPKLVEGVVIWRGRVAPMIDMRIHFSSHRPLYENLTDVIVLNIADRPVCMVVDGISDVIELMPGQMKPLQQNDSALVADCLIARAEYHQQDVLLVDIDKVLFDAGTRPDQKMAA